MYDARALAANDAHTLAANVAHFAKKGCWASVRRRGKPAGGYNKPFFGKAKRVRAEDGPEAADKWQRENQHLYVPKSGALFGRYDPEI